MRSAPSSYELPKHIERHLAALAKFYVQEGKRQLGEIIVNAQPRIHEGWSIDGWNGGTYGHALYLLIPDRLFLSAIKQKEAIQSEIKKDLNEVHNVQNEFIQEVFLEISEATDHDWRKNSGLLLAGSRTILPGAAERIWGREGYQLFLSHKADVKKETCELQEQLRLFGISSFVAHKDIHPTREWQNEIENALASMDAFVALMSPNFHESDWTDQEVGFALARGVPIIAVRLGRDPYGFIGKFQSLGSTWDSAALDIAKLLIKHDKMFGAYLQALRRCSSWEDGNTQATLLPSIQQLTRDQIDGLVAVFNETQKLHGSFGFTGSRPIQYGRGLVSHLNRLDTREFKLVRPGVIEVVQTGKS